MNALKILSLSSYGLRYKLKISFYLMSVLPLLICFYLISTYILPSVGIQLNMAVLIAVSVFIAASGFFIIKQIIHPIINISSQAKGIVNGNIDYQIRAQRDDEIGDLENALNHLTLRIKDNMQELKKYSEETKEINLEINRKVMALSGLLQVSSFISSGADIDEILNLSMEKMAQIGDSDLAFLLLQEGEDLSVRSAYGTGAEGLLGKKFKPSDNNLFTKLIREVKSFSLGSNTVKSRLTLEFAQGFGVQNAFIAPITIHNKIAGLAGIGNNSDYAYKDDEFKLIDIFIKQIAIAIENDILMHKVKNLEVRDALTGLYNESFIKTRLDEEIKRAIMYQRPCAFIIFSVDRYKELCQDLSLPEIESVFKRIAVILKENITEIDKAARFSEREFALLLLEKNKKQAQNIADVIKERIEYFFKEESDKHKRLTISVGVAENPIDGVTGSDLINKAMEALIK